MSQSSLSTKTLRRAGIDLNYYDAVYVLMLYITAISCRFTSSEQGWKLKPKPKPENPVLKEILETQTETDSYLAKILKT